MSAASLSDEEVAERLAGIGIGPMSVCSYSAIVNGQPIAHATMPGGTRTLCGRDCTAWARDPQHVGGPDCARCRRRWDALGADSKLGA